MRARENARVARSVSRTVSVLSALVCVLCVIAVVSMMPVADQDRAEVKIDLFVAGGTFLLAVGCGYLATVFGDQEATLPDETERWLPASGEVPDAGGLRRVRAVFRRAALISVLWVTAFFVFASIQGNRPDGDDTFVPYILVAFACAIRSPITAVTWLGRYRAVLRTGWRQAKAVETRMYRSPSVVHLRYADKSTVEVRKPYSLRGLRYDVTAKAVLVGGSGRGMVILSFPESVPLQYQHRARPVAASGKGWYATTRRTPTAPVVTSALRPARFRQTACRVVIMLSAIGFLLAVSDLVSVLPVDDSTYTEMSVAVLVSVTTLVLGAFASYWLGIFADRELTLRASGDDDTPLWLPPATVTANTTATRQVRGVFWRSTAYAGLCLAALVGVAATVTEAAYGLVVLAALVGFLVFGVTSVKWLARHRETRRTGWRPARAKVGEGGVLVVLRYDDRTQVRAVPAWSTRRPARYAVTEQDVWVGGGGRRMAVVFPSGVVPVQGLTFRAKRTCAR